MRKTLTSIALASLMYGAGCAHDTTQTPQNLLPAQKSSTPTESLYARTNAYDVSSEQIKMKAAGAYFTDEAIIGGEAYRVLPLEENEAVKIASSGKIILHPLGGSYLVKKTNSVDRTKENTTLVAPRDPTEVYVLTNATLDKTTKKLTFGEGLNSGRFIVSQYTTQTTSQLSASHGSQKSTLEHIMADIDVTTMSGAPYYSLEICEDLLPNKNTLPIVYISKPGAGAITERSYTGDKTNVIVTVQGISFVPERAEIIQKPRPAPVVPDTPKRTKVQGLLPSIFFPSTLPSK